MSQKPEIIHGDELILDTFFGALGSVTPATAKLLVDGTLYSPTDLAKKIDEERQPYKAVRGLNNDLKTAREDLKVKKKDIRRFVNALHIGAKAYLGDANPEIEKYGFQPDKKAPPLSAEKLKDKVQKARLTRAMRHTMGKRQKAGIKATDVPPSPPPPPAGNAAPGTPGTSK